MGVQLSNTGVLLSRMGLTVCVVLCQMASVTPARPNTSSPRDGGLFTGEAPQVSQRSEEEEEYNPPSPRRSQEEILASLKEILDRNSGTVVQRTWGREMFGSDDAAMPRLLEFMAENPTLEVKQIVGEEGILKTKYAESTYNKDVRIWHFRERHPDDFELVIEGEVSNTEARATFAKHGKDWFDKVRSMMDKFISEEMGTKKKTVKEEWRERAYTYVEQNLEITLIDKEKKYINSWLKAGKTNSQAGATKRKAINYEDPAVLKKALIHISKNLDEELGIKMSWKKLASDTTGLELKRKLQEQEEEEGGEEEA